MKHSIRIIVVVFLAVLLGGCHNSQTYSVLKNECPSFEKKFPKKTAEINRFFTDSDKTYVIEFSSFEEAEWKMIHFFFPDEEPEGLYDSKFDYDLFKQVVLSDTSSMLYSFDSIMQYANISIVESDDGLVRIYTWEPPHFWTMSDYRKLIQYRWNGKVLVQECEQEDCAEYAAEGIYTISGKEKDYYLVSYSVREWRTLSFTTFWAFVLNEKGLEPVALFESEDGLMEYIGFECEAIDWFGKTQGKGYDWLGYYDEENQTYYLPEEDYRINDRYYQYVFNGDRFEKQDDPVANPFLTPLLHEYKCLVKWFETERNKIRIDLMEDGTYRYSAWKVTDKMIDDPVMVIHNGQYDEDSSRFVFKNDEYEYQVFDDCVCVVKDGKRIEEWSVVVK